MVIVQLKPIISKMFSFLFRVCHFLYTQVNNTGPRGNGGYGGGYGGGGTQGQDGLPGVAVIEINWVWLMCQ